MVKLLQPTHRLDNRVSDIIRLVALNTMNNVVNLDTNPPPPLAVMTTS